MAKRRSKGSSAKKSKARRVVKQSPLTPPTPPIPALVKVVALAQALDPESKQKHERDLSTLAAQGYRVVAATSSQNFSIITVMQKDGKGEETT